MTDEPSTALTEQPQGRGLLASAIDMRVDATKASLVPDNLGEVVAFANLMSRAGVAVPKHLRETPGACLAVSMQAFHWGMEPFAVANKSYSVNDRMAYEAQLIAAVVIKLVPHVGYPRYSYAGEGEKRRCTVEITTDDGEVVPLESPEIGNIQPKSSPLWKTDPDQQLGYYTIRAWSRRHRPDVLLGVYDREEAASFTRDAEAGIATSFEQLEQHAAEAADAPKPEPERRARPTKAAAPTAEPDKATLASATPASEGSQAKAASGQQEPSPASGDGEKGTDDAGESQASTTDASTGTSSGADQSETASTDAPGEKDAASPQVDSPATSAEPDTTAKDSAPPASAASPAADKKAPPKGKAPPVAKPDKLVPGLPLAGENYVIADEALNEQGGRNLYKDGQVTKSMHPSATSAYSAYAGHPATSDPAPIDRAQNGSEASQERAEGESRSPASSDASPDPAREDDALGAFGDYADAVAEANDWAEIDHALSDLMPTAEWKEHKEARNPARRVAYARIDDLSHNLDLRTNLRAWRCYIEWETDLGALQRGIASVHSMGNPAWAALAKPARDALDNAAFARKHALESTREDQASDFE